VAAVAFERLRRERKRGRKKERNETAYYRGLDATHLSVKHGAKIHGVMLDAKIYGVKPRAKSPSPLPRQRHDAWSWRQ
jgi:hypothetical protein